MTRNKKGITFHCFNKNGHYYANKCRDNESVSDGEMQKKEGKAESDITLLTFEDFLDDQDNLEYLPLINTLTVDNSLIIMSTTATSHINADELFCKAMYGTGS